MKNNGHEEESESMEDDESSPKLYHHLRDMDEKKKRIRELKGSKNQITRRLIKTITPERLGLQYTQI